jgi:hypothetical protein
VKPRNDDHLLDWVELKKGNHWNVNHMQYWKKIACGQSTNMSELLQRMLVPVATALLALPASESMDEVCFSGAGQAYTKERTLLSNQNMERMMVIRTEVQKTWLVVGTV